ncbi:uncharacterized protein LOC115293317 isoform X2 [Suricata suricatta]|uniref:uncharacterized protein LOC115293317 isoform X2 n=1 Tax=Suricata suricatta TaxID=37032 RepID=UPI00115575BD|nr:uncharacterized protein LOC115293317 isoform X2 [Suricata suricatta]
MICLKQNDPLPSRDEWGLWVPGAPGSTHPCPPRPLPSARVFGTDPSPELPAPRGRSRSCTCPAPPCLPGGPRTVHTASERLAEETARAASAGKGPGQRSPRGARGNRRRHTHPCKRCGDVTLQCDPAWPSRPSPRSTDEFCDPAQNPVHRPQQQLGPHQLRAESPRCPSTGPWSRERASPAQACTAPTRWCRVENQSPLTSNSQSDSLGAGRGQRGAPGAGGPGLRTAAAALVTPTPARARHTRLSAGSGPGPTQYLDERPEPRPFTSGVLLHAGHRGHSRPEDATSCSGPCRCGRAWHKGLPGSSRCTGATSLREESKLPPEPQRSGGRNERLSGAALETPGSCSGILERQHLVEHYAEGRLPSEPSDCANPVPAPRA